MHGVEKVITNAAIDDIDSAFTLCCAHVNRIVSRNEFSPRGELHTHLSSKEGVFEIRRIVHVRRKNDHGGVTARICWNL